jgi:F-type H+-transporting ATPase subunit delta
MAEQAQAPTVSGMAGRYATALFELALEEKKLDAVKADLERFEALIGGAPTSSSGPQPGLLRRRAIQGARRHPEKAGIGGIADNFLKVVTRNRRLFAVRDIIRVSASWSRSTRAKSPPK